LALYQFQTQLLTNGNDTNGNGGTLQGVQRHAGILGVEQTI
jgi:hypothetical protein